MSSINQEQLAEYAKKLKDYNRQAIEALFEPDIEALAIIISDYIALKKYIRISDINSHIITIPDKEVIDIYGKISSKNLTIE
jgi:ABC-type enterochelin transport system substrate-binding protein